MMDASSMYPEGFHPLAPTRKPDYTFSAKHYTRTKRPPKYYIIDFGLSCRYDPANGPPRDYPIRGGDKSVPEFEDDGEYQLYDPFPTDVYYLGNMIRTAFLVVCVIIFLADDLCYTLLTAFFQGRYNP